MFILLFELCCTILLNYMLISCYDEEAELGLWPEVIS